MPSMVGCSGADVCILRPCCVEIALAAHAAADVLLTDSAVSFLIY
jgi:hypothetical protein